MSALPEVPQGNLTDGPVVMPQLATSPLSAQLLSSAELLRGMSPALVRQVLPLVDQLLPVFLDVANGTQTFTPPKDETQKMLSSYYGAQLRSSALVAHFPRSVPQSSASK